MTLDPSPPVLGDEAARVRATAVRQWRDRRALERQLHDGAALRISALALRLGLLRHAMPDGTRSGGKEFSAKEFGAAVDELQDELHLALQELRDVAGRLYPPLLDEAGLGPALREVAARCPVPMRVDAPDERFGAAAEGAAYFALLDCLPDGPSDGLRAVQPVEVVVRREGDVLVLFLSGVDACHAASVHDGVRLLGGTVAVGGAGGGAAPITVRIPCA